MTARAVFDCMVFLQAAGRPNSPARACFRLVDEGKVTLCVSAEILAEVRDVLTHPKVLKRFPLLTPKWAETFISNAESKAIVIGVVPKAFTLERDPKDEPYLNLAIATRSLYRVSRDKDLLDLMSDESFRTQYPALTILEPPAFLQVITSAEQPAPPNPGAGDVSSIQ